MCQTPCEPNDPRLLAWEAWKKTERFPVCKQWALTEQHVEGSLWEAFQAGRDSASPSPSSVEHVETARAVK